MILCPSLWGYARWFICISKVFLYASVPLVPITLEIMVHTAEGSLVCSNWRTDLPQQQPGFLGTL